MSVTQTLSRPIYADKGGYPAFLKIASSDITYDAKVSALSDKFKVSFSAARKWLRNHKAEQAQVEA